MTTWWI